MSEKIHFILNGEVIDAECTATARLLDVLRDDYNLVGVKCGCSEGECGACAVLVNGNIMNSCMVAMGSIEGASIMTIEGYSKTNKFLVVEKAFASAGAVQCGFCTPGMMIATEALLLKNPNPTEAEIREGLSGNLCRCTGYNMIVEAVAAAAKEGAGLW